MGTIVSSRFSKNQIPNDKVRNIKEIKTKIKTKTKTKTKTNASPTISIKQANFFLHDSHNQRNFRKMIFFIDQGADINSTVKQSMYEPVTHRIVETKSMTLLVMSCANNDSEMVDFLLSYPEIDTNSNRGIPALCFAAYFGNPYIVSQLLKHGANINSRTDTNETALHWAAANDHFDVISVLVDHGINMHVKTIGTKHKAVEYAIDLDIRLHLIHLDVFGNT